MKIYANPNKDSDPIFYSVPDPGDQAPEGWYFWDETWSKASGPYSGYSVACENLKVYVETYLGTQADGKKNKEA